MERYLKEAMVTVTDRLYKIERAEKDEDGWESIDFDYDVVRREGYGRGREYDVQEERVSRLRDGVNRLREQYADTLKTFDQMKVQQGVSFFFFL